MAVPNKVFRIIQGDSGGLLTCDGKGLTGVVSFGYECGLSDYPGIVELVFP